MPPSESEPLASLADSWRLAIAPARRRLALAVVALAVVVALLVARQGTSKARLAAVVGLASVIALVGLLAWIERRFWTDPRRVILRIAGRIDPERAHRALRALSLLTPQGDVARADGISEELARLHVARSLAALPAGPIAARAQRVAKRLKVAGLVVAAGMVALTLTRPWSVLEGLDVMLAKDGVGAFSMAWLDNPEVRARPPEYLHMDERRELPFGSMSLPYGTVLTFRGVPLHAGRRLSLTDGIDTVDFVDDGSSGLVARWSLKQDVDLRVVARFGQVTIHEPESTHVRSIADEAPIVKLEGAPRSVMLASDDDDGEVSIRYEATDDHGLREVHLVLRSGTREERRVLARLDGDTRFDRGGYVLRSRDAFVRKSHAPVEVRVEAKDNDPLTGPKWGASLPITLVPPDVGEPEARRLDGLRRLRDAYVDALAARMSREPPSNDEAARQAFAKNEVRVHEQMSELLDTTLATAYAGVHVPGKLRALLKGQMSKMHAAVSAEARSVTSTSHAATVRAHERLVLVVDAVVRGLGQKDTKDAARQLAEVADDLALGASQISRGAERERGVARMEASTHVLSGGGRSMKRLGSLGRDIGEIVETDLLRVGRASKDDDFMHAELAAKDLATRLREPDASFASEGGSGRGGGGGEAGGGRGTPGDEPSEPDDAAQAFNQAAQELERLSEDHTGEIGQVERELNGALSAEELEQLKEEAKKHAQNIRDAAKGLPSIGGGSDSWTSKGAAAKEHAEQMAKSLEDGNPADGVTSGHNAMNALDEARRMAARERFMMDRDPDAPKKIEDAKKALEVEVKWAEEKLAELRKRAAERAGKQLGEHGDEEGKLAERAGKLGEKGRESGALPPSAVEALEEAERAAREAADALKRGEADKGLDKQREAQRKLETAKQALSDQQDGERGSEADDGTLSFDHADIPKADAHKGPDEFRRRVMRGLGQSSSGRLKDAVRRYAEGLLR